MALININGTDMPEPSIDNYFVSREPVIKTNVNTKGETIGEFVRYRYYLTFTYRYLTADQFETLANELIQAANTNLPLVIFYDPWTKQNRTSRFYPSPATASLFRSQDYSMQNITIELSER